MLKISEMELAGFKSFSDRASLSFTGGVTAVVGPNGCGKSNISDALSWVLGEQSARSLRGARMEDVIFNGSSERKAQGMAEVTLKLLAPKTEAEAEPLAAEDAYDEILVTRRLFRDGQSEYAMDGKRCRLMDIEERLYGYGIDGKAYAIIEQGRIGLILSGRAADRRLLIEEAAGIHHYKGKKHQAELRLEAASGNLARIDDIIVEVKQQLGKAKRQAARAEKFRELREAHRRVERILFARQFRSRRQAEEDLAAKHASGAERMAEDLAALTASEAEVEERRAARMDAERSLVAAREVLHDVQLRIERKESEARQCQAELADLGTRVESARQGLATAAARIEETERDRGGLAAEEERLAAELAAREQDLATAQEATRQLLAQTREREAAVETAKDGVFGAANALAGVRNSQQKLAALAEKARGTEAKHDFEMKGIALERERLEASAQEIKSRTLSGSEEVARLDSVMAMLRQEAAGARDRATAAEQARESARSARDEGRHRLQSLQEIEDRHWGYEDGVRRFFEEHAELAALSRGLVADHLHVTERFEVAVEAALGEALQWIVVSDRDQARVCARVLAEGGEGRVGFLPLEGPVGELPAEPVPQPALGRVASFVSVAPTAPERLSARLALALPDAVVVDGLDAAWDLVSAHPHLTAVTLHGDVVRAGGALVSGRRGGPGILAVKREVREIGSRLEGLEATLAGAEEEVALARDAERELDQKMRETDEARRKAEREHITLSHELEQIRNAQDRLDQRLGVLQVEIEDVRRELTAYLAEQQELGKEESERAAALASLEEELRRSQDALAAIRDRAPAARAAEEEASRAVGTAREARVRVDSELRALAQRAGELERQRAMLSQEIDAMDLRRQDLGGRLEEAKAQMGTLLEERERAAAEARAREEASSTLQALEEELMTTLRERRAAHDAAREALAALDVERAQVEADLKHLAERCRTMLHASLPEIEALLTPEEEEEPEEELLAESARLAERIDGLGPVNLMAIEEARELEERHDFLTTQRDDVARSMEDIRKAIRKINETSRERFMEAFEQINRHFQEAFLELFGGGVAELRLVGDEDVLEAGVEVVAQPPGKRLQSIQLLSGGEKALSALSLLFGIFQYRPSPFCVLDEVDAPLDEANVGRFTSLLRKMQDRTQFILITHNKTTMEIAEQLYGISMDEPGVSRVYSVRLGPAEGNGNGNGNGHGNGHEAKGNGGGGNGHGVRGKGKKGDIRAMASMTVRRKGQRPPVEEGPAEPPETPAE